MRVLRQITAVGSLAFAIILALQPATSHAQTGFPSEASSSSQLEEMDQEIQTIFTRYLSADKDGFLHVNAEAINQDGKSLSEYQQIADGLNHNPYLNIDHEQDSSSSLDSSQDPGGTTPLHTFGSWDWVKCTINAVVPVSAVEVFLKGWQAWIKRGAYAKVISALIRVVGPAAIKGGIPVAVASLAAGAAWCTTSWAN